MTDQEVGIGHNNPPESLPPEEYGKLVERIDAQLKVTNRWVTERPEITSQDMADACKAHIDQLRELYKEAENLRKDEVAPLNKKKAEIQKRHLGLADRIKFGADLLTKKVQPWLDKVEAMQKAAAAEAAEKARIAQEDAEKKRQEAEKALEAPAPGTDALGALDAATEAEAAAKDAGKAAKKAAKAKPQVGHSTGRAMGVVTVWSAEITDMHRALWAFRDDIGVQEAVRQAANRYVREHKAETDIPGITAKSERKAR